MIITVIRAFEALPIIQEYPTLSIYYPKCSSLNFSSFDWLRSCKNLEFTKQIMLYYDQRESVNLLHRTCQTVSILF